MDEPAENADSYPKMYESYVFEVTGGDLTGVNLTGVDLPAVSSNRQVLRGFAPTALAAGRAHFCHSPRSALFARRRWRAQRNRR